MTANTTNTSPLPTPPVLHLIQHHQSFTYKTANTTNTSPSNTHHSRQDVVTAHKPSENHITKVSYLHTFCNSVKKCNVKKVDSTPEVTRQVN
ncbi:hypothetical protein Pcinc_029823 [Petrolisthes cinctipes]|uniref:Uncharacterized protein n=1 Tax=Petrolisthes cinctipes TaxID=88211 RepID=A0AAE1F025_PETCI|nr:hypothetical protein Pcinc_029823 [Petrolisthes cinctipes]